eukprot:13104104-Alexandrium_andersonii.AAC.1
MAQKCTPPDRRGPVVRPLPGPRAVPRFERLKRLYQPLAHQEQRLAWIADWRVSDWSSPLCVFAASDPLEARF